jgi:3-oxoadipate enol-lactonase
MGAELQHRFDGDPGGEPLLLANSLGAELGMWDEQIPALSERFRVLRYDQRGHGGSPAPPGPYSIEDLGRDALVLLDREDIERTGFAGVSLGGMVGLWLAINAPERIARLAICSSTAGGGPAEPWIERAATVRDQGIGALVEATLERWFTPEFRESHPERIGQIRAMLLGTDPEGYAGCCEAIGGHDLRDRLGEIAAPTLVITAADDPSIGSQQGELLAERIPEARLVALAAGRHLVNVELPEDVNGPLLEHLAGPSGSG